MEAARACPAGLRWRGVRLVWLALAALITPSHQIDAVRVACTRCNVDVWWFDIRAAGSALVSESCVRLVGWLCGSSIVLCCTRRAAASPPCSQYIAVTGSDKSVFVTYAMLVRFRACGRAFTRIILFCETASHLVLSQRMLLWSVKLCTASHVLPSGCAACCDCVFVDSPIRPCQTASRESNRPLPYGLDCADT
jgi:hypothetical protein